MGMHVTAYKDSFYVSSLALLTLTYTFYSLLQDSFLLEIKMNVKQKSFAPWDTTLHCKQGFPCAKKGLCHKMTHLLHFKLRMLHSLTANETPTGLRIHLGGFFNGGIKVVWATCSGTCRGGRICPVPKGSRLLKEEEIYQKSDGKKNKIIILFLSVQIKQNPLSLHN